MENDRITLPETINFHINWHCNADCVFCYRPSGNELTDKQRLHILRLCAEQPQTQSGHPRRINFAGGEPTLVKSLPWLLRGAKSLGLSTSLISNGSLYLKKPSILSDHLPLLDMIGVSIDTVDELTNISIKRPHFNVEKWLDFSSQVKNSNVYFKINTTVCRYNHSQSLASLIENMAPQRWKIFKAIAVEGTEGTTTHKAVDWQITDAEFKAFVQRHADVSPGPVVEDDTAMRGTYIMISPDGCFYDSTKGYYTRSEPILEVGIETALSQIVFSRGRFRARGGLYTIPVVTA